MPAAPAASELPRQFAERPEAVAQERAAAVSGDEMMKRAELGARSAKQEPAGSSDALSGLRLAQDPEAWLRHIAKLVREGRRDEARESLAAFRRQFPNHAVPDELR